MIDTDVTDLIAELSQFGTELEDTTETTLEDIAATLPRELISQIFAVKENRTNSLRDSIKATVSNNQLNLEMNYYGYFQVFGVSGKKVSAFGLPDSVLGALSSTPNGFDHFAFRKIKHPGIFGVRSAANTIAGLEDLIVNTLLED